MADPSGFMDAHDRMEIAEEDLSSVRALYADALRQQAIPTKLRVRVGQVIESFRSALEYCAQELHRRYGKPCAGPIYFPIIGPSSDWRGVLGQNIPGIIKTRPDLASLMESWQVIKGAHNQWLADLGSLANESKHEQILPLTRRERDGFRIGGHNIGVVGGFIQLGKGAVINNHEVSESVRIDPGGTVPDELQGILAPDVWVDLIWDLGGRPVEVLPFLERAVHGVRDIIRALEDAT